MVRLKKLEHLRLKMKQFSDPVFSGWTDGGGGSYPLADLLHGHLLQVGLLQQTPHRLLQLLVTRRLLHHLDERLVVVRTVVCCRLETRGAAPKTPDFKSRSRRKNPRSRSQLLTSASVSYLPAAKHGHVMPIKSVTERPVQHMQFQEQPMSEAVWSLCLCNDSHHQQREQFLKQVIPHVL